MLHGVDEISENFLLLHGNRAEMFADEISQLSFVHPRSCRHFVKLLVSPQSLNLKVGEVRFQGLAVGAGVIRVPYGSLTLRSGLLNFGFVIVANKLRSRLSIEKYENQCKVNKMVHLRIDPVIVLIFVAQFSVCAC